jgi:hypothetical protein
VAGGDETSARRAPQDTKTPEREIEDELSSINPVALRIDEEVTESPRNAPGSGRRQHLSSDPAERGTPTKLKTPQDATRRTRKSMRVVPSPELDAVDEIDELSPDQPRTRPSEQEVDELSPDQPRTQPGKGKIAEEILDGDATRSRRRRSVLEEPDTVEPAKIPDADAAKKRRRRSAREEPDTLEAEEVPDTDAAKQKSRRRRRSALEEEPEERTSKRRQIAEEIPDVDEQEEAEEIPIADVAKKLVSQRRRRSGLEEAEQTGGKQPASSRPSKASPAKQRAPKTRKPAGAKRRGAVPVTTYRMTRHDSDSGDDILNRAIPFASRNGVNAVDVLAQACDEFAGSAVDALGRGLEGAGSSAERREYRTKLLAVEAFAEESRWKLMELTISLDAEYAMRKRVRAVVKEKGELRAELMRLRAEREQVALKMDAARIQHEEEGKDKEVSFFLPLQFVANFQTLVSLSTTLHDVALAASLGRDTASGDSLAQPPLPVVINEVAAMASRKSREGGLLKRLKDFNGFLERVAGAVEGR